MAKMRPWFFILWRTGFPSFVIGYALLKDADAARTYVRGTVRATVGTSAVLSASLVVAAVLLNRLASHSLPRLFFEELSSSRLYPYYVGSPVLVTSCVAVVVLWFRRRSLLDLWLIVVMSLFVIEVPLSFWPNPARFSISWYAFRGIDIFASGVVLVVLLYEITTLYVRLLLAVSAQRREREARLLTGDAIAAAIAHDQRPPRTRTSARQRGRRSDSTRP